jgi:hypothetical protein
MEITEFTTPPHTHTQNVDFKRVTCVYVLTSKETDFYYEQFLISVTSLRLHSPSAYVALLTDDKTAATLVGKRTAYKDLIDEIKIVDFPPESNSYYRSRYLKTKMRELIAGDFLYIDVDTVVADDLSEICNLQINVGAVYNCHSAVAKNIQKDWILNLDRKSGFDAAEKTGIYYNSGVIFAKDNDVAREFFQKWHELWLETYKKGINKDQPALSQANYLMNCVITELSGKWNCQIVKQDALKYLPDAKIIHYFNYKGDNNIYKFGQPSLHLDIKQSGAVSEEIIKALDNPRYAFVNMVTAVSMREINQLKYEINQLKILDREFNVNNISLHRILKVFFKRLLGKIKK